MSLGINKRMNERQNLFKPFYNSNMGVKLKKGHSTAGTPMLKGLTNVDNFAAVITVKVLQLFSFPV